MKKNISIMLLAATLILCGCTDVEELPEDSVSVTASIPAEGSMVVSLGAGTVHGTGTESKTEGTSEQSITESVQTSAAGTSVDEIHASESTAQTAAQTTSSVTSAATATEAADELHAGFVQELEKQIQQEILDGNYVKATAMMEENSQALSDPSFEVTKIQMWYYFNEVAESYYMAAEEYYNEQVKLGNKCATGFEGYNMVNSTLDAGVISDRVPEEYAEAAERVYIKCTDSNGIYVRIPVCEYVSSYPNNLDQA